jgi:glycerate 2-kinase
LSDRREWADRLGWEDAWVQILVACDRIGGLSSWQAGEAVASGWPGESIDVVPVGESGRGFVQAYAERAGSVVQTVADSRGVTTLVRCEDQTITLGWESLAGRTDPVAAGLPFTATSWPWGQGLRWALEQQPAAVYVDLGGAWVHDGGAGLLGALGARANVALDAGVAALSGIDRIELERPRGLLAGVDLIGVIPEPHLSAQLLGLRGITSRLGREHGEDPARLLDTDSTLERFATLVDGQVADAPGSGACGGLGFAVLALGGRLVTGPSVTLPAPTVQPRPDLVLTGCGSFDFASRGGGVIADVARLAAALLAPCVLLAGEVFVGSREMRAMGIEAAYAARTTPRRPIDDPWSPTATDLADLARRVARTWHW